MAPPLQLFHTETHGQLGLLDHTLIGGAYMVLMIGLVTMTTLIWVLAHSLAGESEAEKRRLSLESRYTIPTTPAETRGRLPLAA